MIRTKRARGLPSDFIVRGLFICQNIVMNEYVIRLIKCGYSYERAYDLCADFLRNFPLLYLQYFVETVEKNVGVF